MGTLHGIAGGHDRDQRAEPHVSDGGQFGFQLVVFEQESVEIRVGRHVFHLTAVFAVRLDDANPTQPVSIELIHLTVALSNV